MVFNLPPYYTQNIQTGNANAQSSVQTNIEGNGSVSTHIEVNANGEKKVLDSNSPGTYKLNVQSNGNNSNINNETIISPVTSPSSSSTPAITKRTEIRKFSFLLNIENDVQNFFAKIFSAFKSK